MIMPSPSAPPAPATTPPTAPPTALVADDEPVLRAALIRHLRDLWPDLVIVAEARNGREAIALFEAKKPDLCFLDIHMPGLSGLDAARAIARRAEIVFVTAFDHHAVAAFAEGAVDYVMKPIVAERLADTVARLKARLAARVPIPDIAALLTRLGAYLGAGQATTPPAPSTVPPETTPGPPLLGTQLGMSGERLRWITAQVGQTLRMIPVADIDYLAADLKYTRIVWRNAAGEPAEALLRSSLKDLTAKLDPDQFVQIHRSAVVNRAAVSHVVCGENETGTLYLKGRTETLPVSRSHLHSFRQVL